MNTPLEVTQANGPLSREPRTQKVPQRSPRTSRQDLLAKSVVLDNEARKNFKSLTKQYQKLFNPRNPVEQNFIEEMAVATWRMQRTRAIETRMLNDALPQPTATGHNYADEMSRMASSFASLSGTPQLSHLHLQEGRLHQAIQRSLRNMVLLRKLMLKSEKTTQPGTTGEQPSIRVHPRSFAGKTRVTNLRKRTQIKIADLRRQRPTNQRITQYHN